MQIIETHIKDLVVLELTVFGDDRGYFFESFNEKWFHEEVDQTIHFVQDNQSKSQQNVLRGLHFQNPPYEQGKLVRVIQGSVMDIAVDIRKESPTYGEHVSIILSASNNKMLWIPPGFAHGFASLEDDTIFSYKCTNYYNKDSEGSILWNDSILNIDWKISSPILSDKDQVSEKFSSFVSQF